MRFDFTFIILKSTRTNALFCTHIEGYRTRARGILNLLLAPPFTGLSEWKP